jgi:hypothetical protein
MPHYYKLGLLLAALALPYFVFAYRNSFASGRRTFMRAAAAVLLGWILLLVYRFVIVEFDTMLAQSEEELQAIYAGDGAKNVMALYFGWVLPTAVVVAAWLFHRGVALAKKKLAVPSPKTFG